MKATGNSRSLRGHAANQPLPFYQLAGDTIAISRTKNSTVVCFAFDGTRLVGAARALSDREYHATVYDVAVHPEYQRRGIGTRLMNELMAMLPVWRVFLIADGDAIPAHRGL